MDVTLTEEERQMVLIALAQLSVARPGWEQALHGIACKMDNVDDGRALMFDAFRSFKLSEDERK